MTVMITMVGTIAATIAATTSNMSVLTPRGKLPGSSPCYECWWGYKPSLPDVFKTPIKTSLFSPAYLQIRASQSSSVSLEHGPQIQFFM